MRVEGVDPDYVSKVLGVDSDWMERADNVKFFTGLWIRHIDASLRTTMRPGAQIEYWCDFLEARQSGVEELPIGKRVTIDCWIDDPDVDLDLPPEILRRLSGLKVGVRYLIDDVTSTVHYPQRTRLVWHPVNESDKAAEYLLEQLTGSFVREKVRERIDILKGSFFAILPDDAQPEMIDDWEHSCPEDGLGYPLNPNTLLDDAVGRFLRLDRQSKVVSPAYALWIPGQPDDDSERNLVISNGMPGTEPSGPSGSQAEINDLPPHTALYPGFILYFYRSNSPKRATLDDRDVDVLAENLVGLAVDALDFETFLVWWRTDLVQFPGAAVAPLPENPEFRA